MNSHLSSEEPLPPDEAFVDAALSEKARLGSLEYDDVLVRNILLETVERPVRAEMVRSESQEERKLWLIGSAAAAAVAVLLVGMLAALPFRQDRFEEEVLFIVQHGNEVTEEEIAASSTITPESKVARPYEGPLSLNTGNLQADTTLSIADSDLELTTIFGQSISDFSPRALRRESFRITADETKVHEDEKIYSGNVVLIYGGFEITAQSVHVNRADHGDLSSNTRSVIAHEVNLNQQSPSREIVASKLEFDPLSGSLVLSGVSGFQSEANEEGHLAISEDQQILLKGSHLAVTSKGGESEMEVKYANPLPKRNKSE